MEERKELIEKIKELRAKEEYLERKLTEMDEYIKNFEETITYEYSSDEDSMSPCCTRALKLGLSNCPKCDDKYE